MTKSTWIIRNLTSKIIAVIAFLILVWLANLVEGFINNGLYSSIVGFMNFNIILIIIIALVFFIGDAFDIVGFPFNFPAPLFNAVGGMFLTVFIFRVLALVNGFIAGNPLEIILSIAPVVYVLVFTIVLIGGYLRIFSRARRRHRRKKPMTNLVKSDVELMDEPKDIDGIDKVKKREKNKSKKKVKRG